MIIAPIPKHEVASGNSFCHTMPANKTHTGVIDKRGIVDERLDDCSPQVRKRRRGGKSLLRNDYFRGCQKLLLLYLESA